MRARSHSRLLLATMAVLAGLLSAGIHSGCSSKSPAKPPLEALFDEGRATFYAAVADDVERHPLRDRLNAAEKAKIRDLQNVYPRLYGLLTNYYYQKDAPVFQALLDEAGEASQRRFREKYLDLARFCAQMFADSLFQPSAWGSYFKDLIPRFNGKDTVDIVAMSVGHMAKLDLPTPDKIKKKTLSPEFEKQWGLDAAKFRGAHKLTRGRGVRVAVLDSGIDMTHPVFQNTVWGPHFNFVGRDGFPWSPVGPPMVDWGWHGTIVSSIVARYAPEAQITMYRYLDADTQNDSPLPRSVTGQMGAAVYKAVHDGNDVINISAGTNLHVPYLQEACQYAYDNNVILVTTSPYYMGKYLGGNEDYPGQYTVNIAVTAITRLAENKYGYWDIAAPESTTTVGSPDAPFVGYPTYVGEKDEYAAGISCATPIVASLTALVASVYPRLGTEPPGQYAETVKRLLTENADAQAVGFDGFSPECGYGLIDAEKTVKAALRLAEARRVQSPAAEEARPAPSANADDVFSEGAQVFYRQLKLELGLHPEKLRLLPAEIDKIERGADGIPGLYEDVVNILFWETGPELMALRKKNDLPAFKEKYRALCRTAADRFVESLFSESPDTQALLASAPNLGRGRLDLVLASLGRRSGPLPPPDVLKKMSSLALDQTPAFILGKFGEAQKSGKGKGIKLAVIDSGWAPAAEAAQKAKINHAGDFSFVGRTQAPWSGETVTPGDDSGRGTLMALMASRFAPEAEIRTYRTGGGPDSPYEYWPAMELAQAIYKAASDGNDFILTGTAFSGDFPFLKQACQSAYLRNVVIIAPNGLLPSGKAEECPAYPAAYGSTIAVAGASGEGKDHPTPWAPSSPSKSTAVTAPAFPGAGLAPSNAYAVSACGGLTALLSPNIPKTGKELPGQYVQRISEILKKAADPKILGFATFNPKIGYGLLNAENAVGPAVRTYTKKMNELDDTFKKRMAQMAKEAEEAAQKDAAEKETRSSQ
jgi:hypothetical protein